MDLKFYLNKIIKIDNIEGYTLKSLKSIKKCYDDFLEGSEGLDPDYPGIDFGKSKGKKVKGKNKIQALQSAGVFNEDNNYWGSCPKEKGNGFDPSYINLTK